MKSLLALHGPHTELAGHLGGVAETVKYGPVSVQDQLQLLVKRYSQAVHGYHILVTFWSVKSITFPAGTGVVIVPLGV